jgi:hypothetical protein
MTKHILNFILGSLTTWECDNERVGEEIRVLQDYLIEHLTHNDNFLLEVILIHILITKDNELLGRKIRTFLEDIKYELNDK